MPVTPLPADRLYAVVDPVSIPFERSDLAPAHDTPVGQDRAVEAVHFGIGMGGQGYNLFCMGPEGTGKASLVRRFLSEAAASQAVPDDWCYVHNFTEAYKPRALRLPAGRARPFARAMAELIEDLRHAVPQAFEGEEYRNKRKALEDQFRGRQDTLLEEKRAEAEKQHVAILQTPMGLTIAPVRDGEVLGADEFKRLSAEEQEALKGRMKAVQEDLERAMRQVPKWDRERREKVRALDRATADAVVRQGIDEIKERYADCDGVLAYLDEVHHDILDNVGLFMTRSEDEEQQGLASLRQAIQGDSESRFRRYAVNTLICHDNGDGAPLIEEDHPIQPNLVGRVEYRQELGALSTDFSLIKPGALHLANGGFLVIEARKLLLSPFAYQDLKRALRKGEIRIESPQAAYGLLSTQSLEPEPIPLDVKVVLLGEPIIFYMLSEYDPDFGELFKAVADFNTQMPRTADNVSDLSLLLASMAREKDILPLDRGAVARVIEHGCRLAGDATRLTTHMGHLLDLMREAEYEALREASDLVTADHVRAAIRGQRRRTDRVPTLIREEMEREIIKIRTEGTALGQVNGLAVIQIGNTAFGKPSRITVQVGIGKGEVTDIERESELGGPLHSKGVMILTSFLHGRFGKDMPLGLHANLVFEQSYGMVDGDSASSTELYALLSALADVPLRQSIAVTGSVDQFGRVQAIGGVNEKIEGFFDLCQARGLTGDHGVLIPESNVTHLMLREDIVEACRAGRFHVWPVAHVDEGIEVLTGRPAGTADETGEYPLGSINRAVAARLRHFHRRSVELQSEVGGPRRLPGRGQNNGT